jgi:hypothetical protein
MSVPTVVTTMPPRGRRVRLTDWPTDGKTETDVVAFAVWTTGDISPIVELDGVFQTCPVTDTLDPFGPTVRWELTR